MQLILEGNTTAPGGLGGDVIPETISTQALLTNQEALMEKSRFQSWRHAFPGIGRTMGADIMNSFLKVRPSPLTLKGKLGRSERVAWTCIHYQM